MADLPSATVKRILSKQGVTRISPGAVGMATNAAEDLLGVLAQKALQFAAAAKRKTVMEVDMDAARKSTGIL